MGSENNPNCTKVHYKRKFKFHNPIRQNYGHIKSLRSFLGEQFDSVPMFSIIAFTNRATLKFKEPFKNAKVINRSDLISTIHNESSETRLSLFQINKLKQLLLSSQIKDRKRKKEQSKKHIQTIKEDLKKQKSDVQNNTCPRCGNSLVQRHGKRGPFKGCSSFPKCRFTA